MSFLDDYIEYSSNNEAPYCYHLFSGLTALAALTGRRIWLNQGAWNVYGQLYTILVGPPGNGKSVAASIAIRLLRAIDNVPFASMCASPRRLLEEMSERQTTFSYKGKDIQIASLVAVPDEISNFISQEKSLMMDTLTTMWHQDHHTYSTAHAGSFEIHGPSLTLLTCCPREWITQNLKGDIFGGGFSRRGLWIFAGDRSGKIVPPSKLRETERMRVLFQKMVFHGRDVQKVCGDFEYEPGCEEYFDEWYVAEKGRESVMGGGYAESKPGFVVKLAMMEAMSTDLQLLLRKRNIDKALEYLDVMEKNVKKVFQGAGRNPLQDVANELIETLEKSGNGGVSERNMRMMLFRCANGTEIDSVIAHLKNTNQIDLVSKGGKRYFKLLPKLADKEDHTEEQ